MNVFTGESIKERREELNMTQDDLADELGTYRSLISDVECGKNDDELLIADIAYALNVYVDDLV